MIILAKELLDGHLRLRVQQESLPKTTKLRLDEILECLNTVRDLHRHIKREQEVDAIFVIERTDPLGFSAKVVVNTYAFNM